MKELKDLNLMDRFLFSEAMEIPQNMTDVLDIILGKLLPPGETDFNAMGDSYVILIMPFDLFGKGRYMYTFRMTCAEDPSLSLDDGAVRIFLNTHGTNPDEVSPELVELLKYIENSTESTANACKSPRIKNLHKRVQQLKDNEEVTVKYMNRWEELILERKEGEQNKLKKQIQKKLAKSKSVETIAEELEEDDISLIRSLIEEINSEEDSESLNE